MPRSPDSPTDTYLDVLRTLGVTDVALRRHHDAGPETPLRVAIDADRSSPTADLLAALDATGRLLDCRDGLDAGAGDRLTAAFARFGLRIECTEPGTDADGDDLELAVTDDVTGETVRHSIDGDVADPDAPTTALWAALPDADAIAFAELLDGRHLVADARELDALAERYGPRIQPFDDPLLVPGDAIELEDSDGSAEPASTPDASAPTPAESTPDSAETIGQPTSPVTQPTPTVADADDSFGEFVSAVDDAPAEAVEAALADDEPETHTTEGDGEDVAAGSTAAIGGGPRRTVSTTGIDDVFDQLESSAPADEGTAATTTQTMSSSDPPTDPTAPDDADATPNGLTGGLTRTVSSTSADDILERAAGDSDFEAIAAAEGEADPDAVLADAEDVPPVLEDAEVAPELATADSDTATAGDEPTTPDAEGPTATADETEGEVTDDAPADSASPMSTADPGDVQETPIDDSLPKDDAELRRGSESVERPAAPEATGVDVDPDESTDADGPLAAAGGVPRPDDAGGNPDDVEEPVESEEDAGLVGRFTSTIFGR